MDNKGLGSQHNLEPISGWTAGISALGKAVGELQNGIAQSFQQNINIPNMPYGSMHPLPAIKPAYVTKLEEIIEQNKTLNKINSEICTMLDVAGKRIESLEKEVTDIKNSHKHDTLRTVLISLGCATVGAFLGVAFTVLAFKYGLLK